MDKKGTKIEISPIPISEEVSKELLIPASTIIGQVLGAGLNKLAIRARKYYLTTEHELINFQESLSKKANEIPLENRTTENLSITQKSIDDSKYSLSKQEVRELFENLIIASLDDRNNEVIHPRFSSIIKELDVSEAKLLYYFKKHRSIDIIDYYYSNSESTYSFHDNMGYRVWIDPEEQQPDKLPSYTYQISTYNKVDFEQSISILESMSILEKSYYYSSEEKNSECFPWFKNNNSEIDTIILKKLMKFPEIKEFSKSRFHTDGKDEYTLQLYSLTSLGSDLISLI